MSAHSSATYTAAMQSKKIVPRKTEAQGSGFLSCLKLTVSTWAFSFLLSPFSIKIGCWANYRTSLCLRFLFWETIISLKHDSQCLSRMVKNFNGSLLTAEQSSKLVSSSSLITLQSSSTHCPLAMSYASPPPSFCLDPFTNLKPTLLSIQMYLSLVNSFKFF